MRISDWSSYVCSSDLTEVGIMESPDVARAVVERLGLATDPEFRPKPGLLAKLAGTEITPELAANPVEATAEELRKHLDVARSDRKSVVEGKSVSVRVTLGGRGDFKKKKRKKTH